MRINIEIGDIEAFIELTETNSFAKAANNLNLSQPALSRRIQNVRHQRFERMNYAWPFPVALEPDLF